MKRSAVACILALAIGLIAATPGVAAQTRPNILWVIIDDMSANFSCYGETAIETPHVDRLAEQGVMFTNHTTFGHVVNLGVNHALAVLTNNRQRLFIRWCVPFFN